MKGSDSNEHLSAFVDGELQGPARSRVVDALYRSPARRRAWVRYHLIGDAVRKTGPVPGADSIAAAVGEVLAGEPIVRIRPRVRRSKPHPLSGLAIAAAVAAVAVLGIHGLDDEGARSPTVAGASSPELAAAAPVAIDTEPAAARVASVSAPPGGLQAGRLQWSDVAPDAEARLNTYLVNHNEYAGNGMHGVLPWVRIVGYQSPVGDHR